MGGNDPASRAGIGSAIGCRRSRRLNGLPPSPMGWVPDPAGHGRSAGGPYPEDANGGSVAGLPASGATTWNPGAGAWLCRGNSPLRCCGSDHSEGYSSGPAGDLLPDPASWEVAALIEPSAVRRNPGGTSEGGSKRIQGHRRLGSMLNMLPSERYKNDRSASGIEPRPKGAETLYPE